MTSKFTKLMTAAGAAALTAWAGQALAIEASTPYLPGVSVGAPAGALPPPGFYFGDINVIINNGPLNDGAGNYRAGVAAGTYLNIPSIAWSTGWQILGASTYVMSLAQPYVLNGATAAGGVNPATGAITGDNAVNSNGAFNTIFSPINLGWDFKPFFLKAGFTVYADDGYTQTVLAATGPAKGHLQASGSATADNFWTFEPDVALSYLQNGWDFTAHVVLDFNTNDNSTNYQTGNLFYLDLTAAKNIGKWVVGAGGNFTQQFTCDSGSGNFNGCNELQRIMIGPLVGYNFGPVEIDAKALFGISAQNSANTNFYYTSFSFPF